MKAASTHKPMAPIDPLQLLKALSPLLSPDGGIKSTEEVGRLSSLMKKFSRKLVSRCVYVNVLRVSKPETVELFLQKGGWETIFHWLREARECDNSCFMLELLRLYAMLPMTVERLKENDSAKIIKLLTKNGRDDVRALATEVVDSWFKLVKGDPNATLTKASGTKDKSPTPKKKKAVAVKDDKLPAKRPSPSAAGTKKESPKQQQSDKDVAATPKVPSLVIKKDADTLKAVPVGAKSPTEPNHGHPNSKSENNKRALTTVPAKEDLEDVKLPDYIRLTNEPKSVAPTASTEAAAAPQFTRGGVKGERKKSTVKTYRSKMRSVGLEEPTPLPKLVIKKSKDKTLPPPPPPLPLPFSSKSSSSSSLKRPGPSSKDVGGPTLPPLKKTKPPTLLLSVGERPATDGKVAGAKSPSPSASPTAKPPDMDHASQLRREIKLIAPRPKPATHVLTESAGFMDALVAGPVAPIRKKKKLGGPPTTPAALQPSSMSPSKTAAPPMPSPPITAAPKLQFYKDTLDIQEESSSSAAGATADANGSSEAAEGDAADTDHDSRRSSSIDDDVAAAATADDDTVTAGDQSFTSRDTPLSPDAKDDVGGLEALARSLATRKKKRKRVTWAEESDLKQIHYFELDETERVNVNNVKNFGDMKTLERLKERQAVESARRMTDSVTEDRKPWLLIPIDLPRALIVPGSNSLERDVQSQREDSVLQEIFFSKDSIPDAPHEPDPEIAEPEETKIIPLIDENNPNAVVDYSTMEMPAPVSSLPSALSNLVMSLSGKTNTDMTGLGIVNSQQPVDIPGLGELPPPPNHMGGFPPGGQMGPMGPPPPMGYPMGPMDFYIGPRGPMYPPNFGPGGMPNMGNHSEPPPQPPQQMRNRSGRGGFGPMRGGGGGGGGNRGGHGGHGQSRGSGGGSGHSHGPYPPRGNHGGNHNQWNKGDRNKNYHGNGGGGGGGGGNKGGGGGGRPRTTLCRHFINGTCKYGENCSFLHPGVNGPQM